MVCSCYFSFGFRYFFFFWIFGLIWFWNQWSANEMNWIGFIWYCDVLFLRCLVRLGVIGLVCEFSRSAFQLRKFIVYEMKCSSFSWIWIEKEICFKWILEFLSNDFDMDKQCTTVIAFLSLRRIFSWCFYSFSSTISLNFGLSVRLRLTRICTCAA